MASPIKPNTPIAVAGGGGVPSSSASAPSAKAKPVTLLSAAAAAAAAGKPIGAAMLPSTFSSVAKPKFAKSTPVGKGPPAKSAVAKKKGIGIDKSLSSDGKLPKSPPKKKKKTVAKKSDRVSTGGGSVSASSGFKSGVSSKSVSKIGGGGFAGGFGNKSGGALTSPPASKVSVGVGSAGSGSAMAAAAALAHRREVERQEAIRIRAEIARREISEVDAVERAFREDVAVWTGPDLVVPPGTFWGSGLGASQWTAGAGVDGSGSKITKEGGSNAHQTDAAMSRAFMYEEGFAGIGGRSWMDAVKNVRESGSGASATLPGKSGENDADHAGGVAKDGAGAAGGEAAKTGGDSFIGESPISGTAREVLPGAVGSGGAGGRLESLTQPPRTVPIEKNRGFLADEVQIIENALRASGLSRRDVTPKAYACFLEQARRYALELIADARDYAHHAGRDIATIIPSDLLLASEMRGDAGVGSTLPPPDKMFEVAEEVNRVPLPPIPSDCYDGAALPPVEDQLTARTFDVVNSVRVAQRMMMGGNVPMSTAEIQAAAKRMAMFKALGVPTCGAKAKPSAIGESTGMTGVVAVGTVAMPEAKSKDGGGTGTVKTVKRPKTAGAYGASRGRQIAVNIKNNNKTAPATGLPLLPSSTSLVGARGATSSSSSPFPSVVKKGATKSKKVQKRKLSEL